MIAVAKPGLKQAKYTTHVDDQCATPSIFTIDMKANWKALDKAPESTIKAAIDNIERSLKTLDIWKQYLEQRLNQQKEVTNGK